MSANVIEFADTINITSRSGKTFPLTISGKANYKPDHIWTNVRYAIEGIAVKIEVVDKAECVVIQPTTAANIKPIVRYFPGINAKYRNCIAISAETKEQIDATQARLVAPHQEEARKLEAQIQDEKDTMPTYLSYHYSEYWPDYAPIEITSRVSRMRHLTEREKRSGSFNKDMLETILVEVERILPDVVQSATLANICTRPQLADNYWPVEESEIVVLRAEWQAWKDEDDAKKKAKKIEQQEKERIEEEQAQAQRTDAEQNELLVWDAGVLYSSAGNKMLHSLGAIFSEKDNQIRLYTTAYAKDIPSANTTYSIREMLKQQGFTFDQTSKEWRIAYSEENGRKVIDLLKQYDTKAWPDHLGFGRCWECGTYSKHLDRDGYCGC